MTDVIPKAQFIPGQKVLIGGDIQGVIERLIYIRNGMAPLYLVEWWDCGEQKSREFHEQDVSEIADD